MRQILAEDKENTRRTSFHLTPRRSSPKGSSYDNASQTGLKVKICAVSNTSCEQYKPRTHFALNIKTANLFIVTNA